MTEPAQPATAPKYRRVVLKISGEGFVHPGERGIAMDAVLHIARQTYHAAQHGVQIAIVIGGGNILRGAQFTSGAECVHEATAHYMGMLATVINGLALQDALESLGCDTRLMTAIRTALISRVSQPSDSRASCRASPFMTVASMPM
jgi:uridylate kinase